MRSAEPTDTNAATAFTATLAVAGFVVALFGVYWDDAWHTDRGRDDLLSAPHLSLYSGVAVAISVAVWWGWQRRAAGWWLVLSGPVGVAVVGAGVTLGSAPVDEWWHQSFGRDAVLWSPPHLLAVVGTIALGSGVVLVVGRSAVALSDRLGAVLRVAAGAGVVGGWQVLVLEYDTDVALFSPMWYLPVLAAGLSAAALTVQAVLRHRVRWSAAWARCGVHGGDDRGNRGVVVDGVLDADRARNSSGDGGRRCHPATSLACIGTFVGVHRGLVRGVFAVSPCGTRRRSPFGRRGRRWYRVRGRGRGDQHRDLRPRGALAPSASWGRPRRWR